MTSIPEHLRDIAIACDQLEKQLAEQKQQLDSLTCEVDVLRQERARLIEERNDYWELVQTILGDDASRNPAGWEAMIQVGLKHGVDFAQGINDLLADMEHMPSEK